MTRSWKSKIPRMFACLEHLPKHPPTAAARAGHLFGQVQDQFPGAAEAPSDSLSFQISTRTAPGSSPSPSTIPNQALSIARLQVCTN